MCCFSLRRRRSSVLRQVIRSDRRKMSNVQRSLLMMADILAIDLHAKQFTYASTECYCFTAGPKDRFRVWIRMALTVIPFSPKWISSSLSPSRYILFGFKVLLSPPRRKGHPATRVMLFLDAERSFQPNDHQLDRRKARALGPGSN